MKEIELASRLSVVRPSATVAVAQRARELKASGVDVLSFSVGEPDFDTPAHILDAAAAAMRAGATRYTAARGLPELREAICEASARRRSGHRHDPSEVVVSVGAKHVLFNLALALYEPGDEVIIPSPYWVSYPEQVRLAGAEPVIAAAGVEEDFKLRPETLRAAITGRTKALILCSPSNPTGAAYSPAELRALADVAAEHDFWIIVDEIYAELVYGGFEQRSMLEVAPELRDRILIVDGVSKTYAMTGWRIGWVLGPARVMKALDTIQSQSTTNPATVAQHAAIAALRGPQDCVEEMRAAFEARRSILVQGLEAIDGVSARMPEGAFYAFASVQGLVGRSAGSTVLEDDLAVAGYLLEEARTAVVPGSAFGAPGFVRISYAASEAQIREGLARIAAAVAKLG
ncbi:MAG: pyridoxal phosphate-dependent aminotransferase [Myxococcales bacterium]|nr:pyridoxal phosphate-dependent aminotransferase [Myxococcales bacterium]